MRKFEVSMTYEVELNGDGELGASPLNLMEAVYAFQSGVEKGVTVNAPVPLGYFCEEIKMSYREIHEF